MAYSARVLLDSISTIGVRLTTLEVTFPRFVLAEFNTHRQLSRNSASSRAVPTSKLIERVERDPVLPLEWGRNKAGMSASELLSAEETQAAKCIWLQARDDAVLRARRLLELNVHKQELNRLLEPFLWHTVIVTATQLGEFLRAALRAQRATRDSRSRASHARCHREEPSRQRRLRRVAYAAAAPGRNRPRFRGSQARFGSALCPSFLLNARRPARNREGSRTLRASQDRSSLEPVRARSNAGQRRGVSRKLSRLDTDASRGGKLQRTTIASAANSAPHVGNLIANQSASPVLRPCA